jgi:hypothetical protein
MSLLLAAVSLSGQSLVSFFVWLVIAGIIYFLLNWALTAIGLPEPFAKVAQVVLILLVVILIINALMVLVGSPFINFG